MIFDKQANNTILNLQKLINKEYEEKESLMSKYTIGAEIEVKFKYFFSDLFKEHFENRKWNEYTQEERDYISSKIDEAEKNIRPLLEATVEAGIPKGLDKYWEFSFNPVNDMTLLYYQIELLKLGNLIPEGEHSLHISIGGLSVDKKIYHVLMILEFLFLKKERILKGYDSVKELNTTWAKKGRAGILKKNQNDLIDAENGAELRTLCLYPETDLYTMLKTLHYLLHNDCYHLINPVIDKMKQMNLPDKNWENFYKNPDIWEKYVENFDDLSSYTKNIFNELI
jgi:hypothetical protein